MNQVTNTAISIDYGSAQLKTLDTVKNAQSKLYAECGIEIENFAPEKESSEYYAHTCLLKTKNILFRIAKKTPTKTGWFVTFWKRGFDNIIAPYDESDPVDFIVVAILKDNKIGQFIFPKSILLKKNIFSANNKGGKRAIRVYSPWDKTASAQAIKTQRWQDQYFVDLSSKNSKKYP